MQNGWVDWKAEAKVFGKVYSKALPTAHTKKLLKRHGF